MPTIKMLRNLGTDLGRSLGLDTRDIITNYREGKDVSAPAKVADVLKEQKIAVDPGDEDVTPTPELAEESTLTASPVADLNAPEAIEKIGHMTSKNKLQAIVEYDTRVTVQNAANERLGSL